MCNVVPKYSRTRKYTVTDLSPLGQFTGEGDRDRSEKREERRDAQMHRCTEVSTAFQSTESKKFSSKSYLPTPCNVRSSVRAVACSIALSQIFSER